MRKSKPLVVSALAAGVLAMIFSCSSSSNSSSPSLDGMSDVPSLNASDYDYSLGGLLNGQSNLTMRSLAGQVGGFSRAACEGYTLKKQLFTDGAQLEAFLCYIRTLEQADLGMTVSTDGWTYYEINFPEHPGQDGPPSVVRVRVGKFADQLKMDACIESGGSFEREVEFRISASDSGYTGYVVNRYAGTNDQDEAMTGTSRIDVTIAGTSASDFTSAEFNAYHQDQSATNSWQSQMSFTADAATATNTLAGAQAYTSTEWNGGSSALNGEWGEDLVGSVKFQTTGSYPAPTLEKCMSWNSQMTEEQANLWCVGKCYNQNGEETPAVDGNCEFLNTGTESFSIDSSSTPPAFAIVANSSSAYYDTVNAATLLDPADLDITSQTGFVEAWDCTAEGSFTSVDATSLADIASCEPTRDNEAWRMCEEQQRLADQADQSG
ncbi:MAG: hypothetical protein V1798_02580 [Pseudomonadota bacterium]